MRLIIGSSLRFRYLVLALGVVLTWFGVARLRDVPVDVFPEFAPPRVEIQTICLGLSSAEVEQLVSVPLENALNGVPDIEVMRSKSVAQLSSILLIFKSGADEIRARQLVSERMALASKTLPTWAAPPFMMPPLSSTSRIMNIGITSKDKSVMDLSMLAYWTIRQRLLGVPGVANIAIWGEQLKMLQVMVDPKRLAAADVTLDQVQEAVSDALDVGLLRYARGAHIGTIGFTRNTQSALSAVRRAGVTPGLTRVPVTRPAEATAVAPAMWPICLCAAEQLAMPSSTTVLASCSSSRSFPGASARRHPWGGGRRWRDEARPARVESIRQSSGQRLSSKIRSTICPRHCCWSCLLVARIILIFLYEVACRDRLHHCIFAPRCSPLDWFCSSPAPRSTQ